ncbi:hypothetical protein NW754_000676 [Fusarium falciforme]|nr:hypothetical protein NW754_000676 [Fusarium falciforme]
MSAEQNDSGSGSGSGSGSARPSEVPTPVRKEKKRVGFHASSDSFARGGGDQAGASRHREDEILSAEQENKRRQQEKDKAEKLSPGTPDLAGPRRPRPALRRNTSYDAPQDREMADLAESRASERQLRSMTDARQRADRLAVSVGSYSAPGSRRGSVDLTEVPSAQPLIEDYESDEDDIPKKTTAIDDGGIYSTLRQRVPRITYDSEPFKHHTDAENLVRSHSRKGKRDLFHQQPSGQASGTATPVLEQNYAHDYVPRPDKYRGGILSSLLKLYHDDRGAPNSGFNTPQTPGTPLMSPRPSPPTSRPTSAMGTPSPLTTSLPTLEWSLQLSQVS